MQNLGQKRFKRSIPSLNASTFFGLDMNGNTEAKLTVLNVLWLLTENKIVQFYKILEILDNLTMKIREPFKFTKILKRLIIYKAYNRILNI